MMKATKEAVIATLRQFKHSPVSNLSKRTLSNHDATAFIIFSLGPSRVHDVRDILMTWRNGDRFPNNWKQEPVMRWDVQTYKMVPTGRTKQVPRGEHFTYLFNNTIAQGYGFVGQNAMTRGNVIYWYTFRGSSGESFRRTYWYRCAPGVYAPTLECVKRISEMQGFFDP
jgi:hypothetical protein